MLTQIFQGIQQIYTEGDTISFRVAIIFILYYISKCLQDRVYYRIDLKYIDDEMIIYCEQQ